VDIGESVISSATIHVYQLAIPSDTPTSWFRSRTERLKR